MKKLLFLIALLCAFALPASGQVSLSPLPLQTFFDSSGRPLSGGKVYTCSSGSSCPGTPLSTFTDATGGTPNTNPIILNSAGQANIWLSGSLAYKFVVQNSGGVVQWTVDGITNPIATTLLGLANTWTALNTFSAGITSAGPNTLNGGGTLSGVYAGNQTLSGTTTHTGQILCKQFENALCIDELNTGAWAGADIGAWLNAAYAALPATGGKIWVMQKAAGGCYSFTTPIVMSVLGKYPDIEGFGNGQVDLTGGHGACLNYTPTSAGTAWVMDYANLSALGGTGHGIKNITLINNQCVTTGGCGSSAVGFAAGTVNSGTYEALFTNFGIYGFTRAFQDLNNKSVNETLVNPVFESNSIAMVVKSPTGVHISGGTIAGNNSGIVCNDTTSSPEMEIFGTQFFSNGTDIDCSNNTGPPGIIDCHACHFEKSAGATTSLMVIGDVDFIQVGGVMEDDSTTGTTATMVSTTGQKLIIDGPTALTGGRTVTSFAVINSPIAGGRISPYFRVPAQFTNVVTGANAANMDVWQLNATPHLFATALLAPDGASALPSIAFRSEPGTGFLRSASGQIKTTLAGTVYDFLSATAHREDVGRTWGFASGSVEATATDTGLSRDAAGVFDVGNGTFKDKTGRLNLGAIGMPSLLLSSTAPTIAAGGCGGAAASIPNNNGSGAFTVNVGTTPTASCTITLPTSTTGWACYANDITTNSTSVFLQKQTGGSTTTAIIQNFSDVAVSTAFVASDILRVNCHAY
jgi:hypothetical protein